MKQDNNNPLEIKEGLFPRFFSWCKKKARTFQFIGILGLLFAGLETYKELTEPDVAEQISNTITSTIQEYEILKPVFIPDSLRSNPEVKILTKYQKEFEKYRLYLLSLDCSPIEEKEDTTKISLYISQYTTYQAYSTESQNMNNLITSICVYERDVVHNETFGNTVNLSKLYKINELQNDVQNERKTIINSLTYCRDKGLNNLTKKEKKEVFENLDLGISSNSELELIRLQSEFYKSFYIATNIRLLEIVN